MCVNPQRYFNFFRILNKHATAAAASVKRCLPVGFGLDGWRWWWRGRGGLWPWLCGGEAAHGQGPRWTHWRLALEDFWTTTLLHQNPANPGSLLLLPTQIIQFAFCISTLSFSLSLCITVSLFSLLPPWFFFLLRFPHSVDEIPNSFAIWLPTLISLAAVRLVAGLWLCSLYLFSRGFCVLTYASFSALSLLNPLTLNVPKEVFCSLN